MHPTLLNREKSASTFRFKDASAVGRRSHPAASDSLPYEDQRISHEESLGLLKRHENPMTQVASRAARGLRVSGIYFTGAVRFANYEATRFRQCPGLIPRTSSRPASCDARNWLSHAWIARSRNSRTHPCTRRYSSLPLCNIACLRLWEGHSDRESFLHPAQARQRFDTDHGLYVARRTSLFHKRARQE